MTKQFSWSYSKWKSFDLCPKKHYEIDIAKNVEDSTEQLLWGNEVHAAIAAAVLHANGLPAQGSGRDRIDPAPLPDGKRMYQKWIDKYGSPSLPGKVSVEHKYALTRDLLPTPWFGGSVWFRGVCDLLRVSGPVAVAVDWKTGKILHDSRQLMLMAQAIFAHNPRIQRIKTEFVWLKDDCTTPEVFDRETIYREWPPILEGVERMHHAAATNTYEPKMNKLCARHCPVKSCAYHGKRPR